MVKRMSAYKARTNFGELLNLVYYKGYEIIVERAGKPTARVVPLSKSDVKPKSKKVNKAKRSLVEFAGIWSDEDVKEIRKGMKEFRTNFKIVRN
jgi:prevent-host-death family protein